MPAPPVAAVCVHRAPCILGMPWGPPSRDPSVRGPRAPSPPAWPHPPPPPAALPSPLPSTPLPAAARLYCLYCLYGLCAGGKVPGEDRGHDLQHGADDGQRGDERGRPGGHVVGGEGCGCRRALLAQRWRQRLMPDNTRAGSPHTRCRTGGGSATAGTFAKGKGVCRTMCGTLWVGGAGPEEGGRGRGITVREQSMGWHGLGYRGGVETVGAPSDNRKPTGEAACCMCEHSDQSMLRGCEAPHCRIVRAESSTQSASASRTAAMYAPACMRTVSQVHAAQCSKAWGSALHGACSHEHVYMHVVLH